MSVVPADDPVRRVLPRRGFALEYLTLAWNVAGIVVLAIAAVAARSVARAGFGLDSLIEIGASAVVIWELPGAGAGRQRRWPRLIGYAFAGGGLPAGAVNGGAGFRLSPGALGARDQLDRADRRGDVALAAGKARTGLALDNPVLRTEGRVTMIDGILARREGTCWCITAPARCGKLGALPRTLSSPTNRS